MPEFYDNLIEPKPICGNCDHHSPSSRGQICANVQSPKHNILTTPDDGCGRFWPCSKRWPDCDHD